MIYHETLQPPQLQNVAPGMKIVMDKVTEATTPLSNLPYEEQVPKKSKEAIWVAQQLANEITTANPATKNWVEFQTQKYVFIARVQGLKESPVLHKNMTLLDICCGTGAIGLSLARKCCSVRACPSSDQF